MKIQPLSHLTLLKAQQLVDQTFPHYPWSHRRLFYSISKPQVVYRWLLRRRWQVTALQDWVAVDNDQVIGTVGIYTNAQDQQEAGWLSWFCVHPDFRGRGLGKELLDFGIQLATRSEKKYLRLYTSTHPSEAKAQLLYERFGFRITGQEPWQGTVYNRIYRERVLN